MKLSPMQRAARQLQRETNAPYITCLYYVHTHAAEATEIQKRTGKSFADSLADAARPHIEKEPA